MPSTRLGLTPLENREVPASTNLFDPAFYLARNPDVAAAVGQGRLTPEQHFRNYGDAERRAGNPLFDPATYLAANGDVRNAVNARQVTAFRHFEVYGQFEDRIANPAFNPHDYLDDNPDVRNAVAGRRTTAFEHFLRSGQFEDRLPFHGFDRSSYLDDNPDVRNAVNAGQTTAVAHYHLSGRHEGRHLASSTPITTTPGQTTTFTGVSQNHSDKKFFNFTPPTSGTLSVLVQTTNGVFAAVEIENAATSVDIFETEPNNGVNSGTVAVTGGVTYLLRVRAPSNSPAAFSVQLRLN